MGATKQAMFDEEERLNNWRPRLEALVAKGALPKELLSREPPLGECSICTFEIAGEPMSDWLDTVQAWSDQGRGPEEDGSPDQDYPCRCDHCDRD